MLALLYVNGVLSDSGSPYLPNIVAVTSCFLGWDPEQGYFSGEVSSLKIYSGAMTQAQVTEAYKALFPILEHFWDFAGETGGSTYTDSVKGIAATMKSDAEARSGIATVIATAKARRTGTVARE